MKDKMSSQVAKRVRLGLLAILLLVALIGCAGDPIDDIFTSDLFPGVTNTYDVGSATLQYRNGYFQNISVNGTALTADNMTAWSLHPPLTTGTHGVTGTFVGTSDAQSLTNKAITMNNSIPIFWKSTLGVPVDVLELWADNNVHVLDGESGDIFLWLGSGTNQRLFLWPTGSTAISTTKDSPTLDFVANYWNAGNSNWEAKIIHNMITAGVAPKSRLEFEIQGVDILRLENNNGTIKTYSDGALDMTTHQINNVVDPALAQDAATKIYVDSIVSGNVTSYVPYVGANTTVNLGAQQLTTTGNVTTGTLNLNANQINNVADPTLAQDAATKVYVDSLSVNYAGMYRHDSGNVTTIQHQNDWHLVNQFVTGYMGGGWTWHEGEHIAITAFVDNGDGKSKLTVAGHTLINGDVLSLSGTTSYDGVWVVEQVAVNTFVIPTAWVADEGAKTAEHGSHFHSATATSAGKYLVTYSLSVVPGSANCVIEATTFYNATQDIKSESVSKLGAITDFQNVSGFSILDVSVNGVISLALKNNTDTGDFTIVDGNMTVVKIGG